MIGIIIAMEEELQELLPSIKNLEIITIKDLTFYKGTISNKDCIIGLSGVGKVNAARTTQIMLDLYNPIKIINIGVSGSCDPSLNIGDIIIATKLYQHDFDISIFNHNPGYIPKVGDCIELPFEELNLLKQKLSSIYPNIYLGTCISGDKFISDREENLFLYKKFGSSCCDMEAASIAQICYLSQVPFLIIRSISDTLKPNIKEEYEKFLKESSHILALILEKYLQS